MNEPPSVALLVETIAGYGSALVAFSGGVDSSVVLTAAARALGPERVIALTARSPSLPAAELAAAGEFCAGLGLSHHVVATSELDVPGYRANGPRRCFFCKSTLMAAARQFAAERGIAEVVTGTNASDVTAGFRPGIAAAASYGARTPLADLGYGKAAVREIARHWRLSTADKPAAACLASRIAYGIEVTSARLARVERAELAVRAALANAGAVHVRVRDLGDRVRVEVDGRLVGQVRADRSLHQAVRRAGFGEVPLTVEEFRSGSMNELLPDPERWR